MDIPTIKTPNYQDIPDELKEIPNWVNWKYETRPGNDKLTKPPLNPNGLGYAQKNNPATWGTFTSVCGNLHNRPDIGIGFMVGTAERQTGYIAVDLDHVLTDGRITDPAAKEIFETLDSYTEITPSGNGLHIWIKADIPADRRTRKGIIEIYDFNHPQYLTMTGDRYGNRETIEERTSEIKEIIEKYLSSTDSEPQPAPIPVETSPAIYRQDSDDDIIQKMTKYDSKAAALWRGDTSGYGKDGNDHSAADQALANKLVYWTNGDAAQADRLFRQSGLMRDKWDDIHDPANNRTYGQMTIDKAMSGFTPRIITAGNAAANQQQGTGTPIQSVEYSSQGQQPAPQGEDVYLYSAAQARADFEDMILIQAEPISTGFVYLNQLLDGGLYPGLITLGAVTGEGKTTLALQIMDNIAASGRDVLIISLEMSRFELMAKSISRLSFQLAEDKNKDAFTARQLLKFGDYKYYSTERLLLIEKAKREYFETIAPHVFIRQAPITGMEINQIKAIMEAHSNQTGAAPVVLVDYIQLLTQPANLRRNLTDKQVIDMNVMNLKQLSRDFNIPVVGISSLNRQAYSTRGNNQKQQGQMMTQENKVTLTDFKESGAIEYSSDILLGLNRASYDDKYKKGTMSLDILKNRNGAKGTYQAFDYYYRFNCFMEKNPLTQHG